jgi:hypothetical protein
VPHAEITQLGYRGSLSKLRCCPWRAGQLARAIHVLRAHETAGLKGSLSGVPLEAIFTLGHRSGILPLTCQMPSQTGRRSHPGGKTVTGWRLHLTQGLLLADAAAIALAATAGKLPLPT